MTTRALLQITGSWLDHIANCDDCKWDGLERCEEASSLLAIMRHDRMEAAEALENTPRDGVTD